MTALATQPSGPSYEDLSLEDALDMRRSIFDRIAQIDAEAAEARKVLVELKTLIELRMEERGSRLFERAGFRGAYAKVKKGSASVSYADALRKALEKIPDVPQAAIDDALPLETKTAVFKPDLRKIRKLADYCADAAAAITNHIVEAKEIEELVIEEIRPMIDVTTSVKSALTGDAEIVLVASEVAA